MPRALAALGLALLALGATPAAALAGTHLTRATAADGDHDGRVDGFTLGFSGAVKGRLAARGVTVRGYRVTSVAKPRGRAVSVHVREGQSCDAGVQPVVTVARQRGRGLTDARKRPIRRLTLDLERRDRRPPRLTCAVTSDHDHDGRLDGIDLTFSKSVRGAAHVHGPFPLAVDRYAVASIATPRGRFLHVALRERGGDDSGALPAVRYVKPVKRALLRGALRGRGGRVGSFAANTTRDGAAPVLRSAATTDANHDGAVDGIVTRWSERVRGAGSRAATAMGAATRLSADGGTTATIAVPGGVGTGARPVWSAATGAVLDLGGNAAPAVGGTAADGAAPVIVGASTVDRGGVAGSVDGLTLTFSEPVRHAAGGAGAFSVAGYRVLAAGAASGAQISLSLAETGGADGGARPAAAYAAGLPGPVTDADGNEAASASLGATVDGVAPRLLGAVTRDRDADGRIDRVEYSFSEPVTASSLACGTCGLSASGLTPTGLGGVSGATVALDVAEGAVDTGLRSVAAYSPFGVGGFADGGGNAVPGGTVLAADGAPPVVVAAGTADADGDGQLDGLDVTFSEPVTTPAQGSANPFAASGGYQVSAVPALNARTTARLTLAEHTLPDTGATPDLRYTGNGAAVRDASGLGVAARDYLALTRDLVPPRLLSAKTRDADHNGRLDGLVLGYSEPLQGSAPSSDFAGSQRPASAAGTVDGSSVVAPVTESAAPDTGDTPAFSYQPTTGSVTDFPAGPGDSADTVAGATARTATDGAPPVLVSATTGEGSAGDDGFIDQIDATFSEPLVDGPLPTADPAAIATGVQVTSLQRATTGANASRRAVITVAKATNPNGGLTPAVSIAAGRLADSAGNDAHGDPVAAADGVRPVPVGARLGDAPGSSACEADPPSGGAADADCVRVTWSEPVSTQAAQTDRFAFSAGVFDPAFIADPPVAATDLRLTAGVSRSAGSETIAYSDGTGPVRDSAGNKGLPAATPVGVKAACVDQEEPPDDGTANPGNPTFSAKGHVLCSRDADWSTITPTASGPLSVGVKPDTALPTEVHVYADAGVTPVVTSGGDAAPGGLDALTFTATAGHTYWIRIDDPSGHEGTYCTIPDYEPGETCNAGTGPGGDDN